MIYLGYLNGKNATEAPGLKDRRRIRAIESVADLFNGFTKRFGESGGPDSEPPIDPHLGA